MKKIFFLILLSIFSKGLFAQGIVNVSPLTGAASVEIPIYTLTNGQVSLPVSLSYNSNGIKPKDIEGSAGIGWQVNAGGQVSRVVRGLPDDVLLDDATVPNTRLGWMSASNPAANSIAGFTIHNNGVDCSNETTDITYLNAHFPNSTNSVSYDTEPDMFYVDAPGLSCQMVYDRAGQKFVPISYQDLVITYSTIGATGLIESFSIANNKGIVYTFFAGEHVNMQTSGGTATYFANQFNQYQNGIDYYDTWVLTGITDMNNNSITLTYNNPTDQSRVSVDPVNLYIPGSGTPLQYNIIKKTTTPLVKTIQSNNANAANQKLAFDYRIFAVGQRGFNTITGMGRSFKFNYNAIQFSGTGYIRYFLNSFNDIGCSSPANYYFTYAGTSYSNNTTILPDSTSKADDYWGYAGYNTNTSLRPKVLVNPSNNSLQRYAIYETNTTGGSYIYSTTVGNTRAAATTNYDAGSLTQIEYVEGGTTTISYEPNNYVDVPSGNIVSGGGIRVKKITDYDERDVTKNMVRNYSYNDPSTGVTSGHPITLPLFAFTIPYSGSAVGSSLWDNNTVISDYDLSHEDHTILYGFSTVSQTGAGSTTYEFTVPATNWDNSAKPSCSDCTTAEWHPTVNYAARNDCSATYGPIKNDSYAYPFIPNPNYDFERGLPKTIKSYNDNGKPVSETDYAYQRSSSPSVITAFNYDDNPGVDLLVKTYGKYNVYFNAGELTSTITKKLFDSQATPQAQTTITTNTYNTTFRQLIQQAITNSDRSVITTHISYIKDYTVTAGSNSNVTAIYQLQQKNVNIPVETYQQITRGTSTVTTGASLTLFDSFATTGGPTIYMPSQQSKIVSQNGLSDFAPFSISGQVLHPDTRYANNVVSNFDSYDNTGYPQTIDDAHKHIQTSVFDHSTNNVTAKFSNAAYKEIAFSDFDTDPVSPQDCSFTITGSGSFTPNGSHTGNAYGLGTSQTISKTITKSSIASNYIFSIWINADHGSGTLSVALKGGGTANATKAFSGGWTYYQLKIPLAAITTGTFTITITSNKAISIDDLLCYPDVAMVNTAAFDPFTNFMTAQTNTNGISGYYTNDIWGRQLYAYDQDKNIVSRKTYVTANDVNNFTAPIIAIEGSGPYKNISTQIGTSEPLVCFTNDITYTWDFGDGTPKVINPTAAYVFHTYTANGNYTIKLTVYSPLYGTKSSTLPVTVTDLPFTKLHYSNTCQPGGTVPSKIGSVEFIQGSTVVYTFDTAHLNGAQVATGVYTVKIYPIGYKYNATTYPYGYGSVTVDPPYQCFAYTGDTYFTLNMDLSATTDLNFKIQPGDCTPH